MSWDPEILAAEIRREFSNAQRSVMPYRLRVGDLLHDARFQAAYMARPAVRDRAKRARTDDKRIERAAKVARVAAARIEIERAMAQGLGERAIMAATDPRLSHAIQAGLQGGRWRWRQ
jgi:hypothetical protein